MIRHSAQERAILAQARQIRADARKAAKRDRAPKVAPERSDKPMDGLRERRPRIRDNAYLAWIRRLPCLANARRYRVIVYGCDAAHIRTGYREAGWPYTGGGEKPDDARTAPFTREMHEEQHAAGDEAGWWASTLNLYPPAVCTQLRRAYEVGGDGATVISEIARWSTDRG